MKTKEFGGTVLNTIDLALSLDDEEMFYGDLLEDEIAMLNDSLNEFVKVYENRYKTKIVAYAFVGNRFSPYGFIGGNGRICGVPCENRNIEEALQGCDDFAFNITKDKHLELVKMDHDGNTTMELRLVTQNEMATYEAFMDDYFNLAEFIYQLGKQPTKLGNTFMSEFGY